MKEEITYNLSVRKPKELLELLIDKFPNGTLISFEGSLKELLIPKVPYSENEFGLLKRNTKTPKMDFWVFELDNETRKYLKVDFLNRIGLRNNVLHILAIFENKELFTSYDCFHKDCVRLNQSSFFNDELVNYLKLSKIID